MCVWVERGIRKRNGDCWWDGLKRERVGVAMYVYHSYRTHTRTPPHTSPSTSPRQPKAKISTHTSVKPIVQALNSLEGILLLPEHHIDIPHEMISDILTDFDLLNLAILGHFHIHVLVKQVKVLLDLLGSVVQRSVECGRLVDVGKEQSWGKGGFDVFSRTAVSVATCANFEIKGAVDSKSGVRRSDGCWLLDVGCECGGEGRRGGGDTYLSFSDPKMEARCSAMASLVLSYF